MIVEANLLGVMWGARTAVEAMREAGGHIINMASMSSFGPAPGLAVYGATKHAVHGFSMSLQGDLQYAGIPILIHAICPDGVDTGIVRERPAEHDSAIISAAPSGFSRRTSPRKVVSVIGERRPVAVIPASRGVLVRSMALFPRLNLRLLPVFKKGGPEEALKGRRSGLSLPSGAILLASPSFWIQTLPPPRRLCSSWDIVFSVLPGSA